MFFFSSCGTVFGLTTYWISLAFVHSGDSFVTSHSAGKFLLDLDVW
jgi:hypothetical protein